MKTNYSIKNFRVFDENGVEFEINPLTILTGRNSSGKSSIAKSITLLDTFMGQVLKAITKGNEIELYKYKLDFTCFPNTILGGFEKVLHRGTDDNHLVIFQYTVYSLMASDDITVKLSFGIQENDELKDGYLELIEIQNSNGDILFVSKREPKKTVFEILTGNKSAGTSLNFNPIKKQALQFILTQTYLSLMANISIKREIDAVDKKTYEEFEEFEKEFVTYIKKIDESEIEDAVKYYTSDLSNKIQLFGGIDNCIDENIDEIIYWALKNDSLFYYPILEDVGSLGGEDLENSLLDASQGIDKDLLYLIKRIIKDFRSSNFNSFNEYIHNKEYEYLNCVNVNQHNTPNCPKSYDMRLYTDLILDPRFSKSLNYDGTNIMGVEIENNDKDKELQEFLEQPITFQLCDKLLFLISSSKDNCFFYEKGSKFPSCYSHKLEKIVCKYAETLIKEVLCPSWSDSFTFIGTSRYEIKRLYSLSEQDQFTQMLKLYFEVKRGLMMHNDKYGSDGIDGFEDFFCTNAGYKPNSFMNKWIRAFGIGQSVSLIRDENTMGVIIKLHRYEGDVEGVSLTDEGHGLTQLLSIIIPIEILIMSSIQVTPKQCYIHESIKCPPVNNKNNTIIIEEPEIHLHPQYQAMLADMFVDAMKYNVHFIIETHSEYLIRRLQLLASGKVDGLCVNRNEIAILYVNDVNSENNINREPQVKCIGICKNGYLDDSFGPGFFDEAASLTRQLM